ncbi:SH3 domain-containing protein [Fischerella sp. JS2]|uniref:SH3 domain-containing protein n=1 Tax=Fischerella sp. JS2 TaxID=2597771 RepID=UPI0028E6547D|nr:SH3 domain-containing protein [Fischerella sp. JS2]
MVTQILKYIFGFILAMAILIGGGFAMALYFMNRVSAPPPKPIYANDNPVVKAQAPKSQTSKTNQVSLEESSPTPQKSPKPEESAQSLPPGAYKARVTWKQGLRLRKEPTADSERTGGVAFNQKVIVLEESSDKDWQKIRLENGEQEGWVKSGNVQKIDEQDDT